MSHETFTNTKTEQHIQTYSEIQNTHTHTRTVEDRASLAQHMQQTILVELYQ